MLNLFEICSIRNFAIRLVRQGKKYSKNSKFIRFDSTPTLIRVTGAVEEDFVVFSKQRYNTHNVSEKLQLKGN